MAMLLRTLPVTLVLFAVPVGVLFLILTGMMIFDVWPVILGLRNFQAETYFAIVSLFAGIIGALSAYQLQTFIAKDSISFQGHILVAWPIYFGVGWLILSFFVFTESPPRGKHVLWPFIFIVSQCGGVAAHLCLMLLRQRILGHGQGHEPERKPGSAA